MERIFVWRFWRRASLGVTLATTWVDGVAGSMGGEWGDGRMSESVSCGVSRAVQSGAGCRARGARGASQRGPSVDNPSMKAE